MRQLHCVALLLSVLLLIGPDGSVSLDVPKSVQDAERKRAREMADLNKRVGDLTTEENLFSATPAEMQKAGMTKEQFAAQIKQAFEQRGAPNVGDGDQLDSLWDEINAGIANDMAAEGKGGSKRKGKKAMGGKHAKSGMDPPENALRWLQLGALAATAVMMWLSKLFKRIIAKNEAEEAKAKATGGGPCGSQPGLDNAVEAHATPSLATEDELVAMTVDELKERAKQLQINDDHMKGIDDAPEGATSALVTMIMAAQQAETAGRIRFLIALSACRVLMSS